MSRVYLIRHGQAGLRHNYDTLSDLGEQQSRLLRDWFAREDIRIDHVIAGRLTRQIETARLAAGVPHIDPRLNEFDLDAVYRELAPVIANQDAQFKLEYETMLAEMKSDDAPVHRQWNRCDVAVFKAWHSGLHATECESWLEFKTRALAALDLIRAVGAHERLAIFTSGTPIGLMVASLFDATDDHAMRLAGACYNTSVTTLRVHANDIRLIGFNSIAHIADPALRSFR